MHDRKIHITIKMIMLLLSFQYRNRSLYNSSCLWHLLVYLFVYYPFNFKAMEVKHVCTREKYLNPSMDFDDTFLDKQHTHHSPLVQFMSIHSLYHKLTSVCLRKFGEYQYSGSNILAQANVYSTFRSTEKARMRTLVSIKCQLFLPEMLKCNKNQFQPNSVKTQLTSQPISTKNE